MHMGKLLYVACYGFFVFSWIHGIQAMVIFRVQPELRMIRTHGARGAKASQEKGLREKEKKKKA